MLMCLACCTPASAQPTPDGRTFAAPHPTVAHSEAVSYTWTCGAQVATLQTSWVSRGGDAGPRTPGPVQVTATVNGRPLSAALQSELQESLRSFGRPPDIGAVCDSGRVVMFASVRNEEGRIEGVVRWPFDPVPAAP